MTPLLIFASLLSVTVGFLLSLKVWLDLSAATEKLAQSHYEIEKLKEQIEQHQSKALAAVEEIQKAANEAIEAAAAEAAAQSRRRKGRALNLEDDKPPTQQRER